MGSNSFWRAVLCCRTPRRAVLVAAGVILANVAMSQTALAAGLTPSSNTALLGAASMPLTLESSSPAANGLVTTKWSGSGGVTDTVTAVPGSTVSIVPTTVNGRIAYTSSVVPPSTATSAMNVGAASPMTTTCYNGDNGLSIAKGCVYNSGNSQECDPNTCLDRKSVV